MKRNVLITGASSGIGSEVASVFAKKGDNIIIHYLTHEKEANELKSKLVKQYHIDAICIKADLRKEKDIKEMIVKIEQHFTTIDIVVNNAGIAMDTVFENKTKENFEKILDVNLIAPFLVSKYVAPIMLKQKKGCIINVSSTNGIDSYYPYSMDYDSSKAGLNILTKNLAIEFAPYIKVNAVAAGWVNTPMNQELSQDYIEEEKSKIALGRFAEPIEIANIIYFLSTNEANYINGSIIIADGGRK